MAITDEESAVSWLETQEQSVRVAFAARCALRAAPGLRFAGIETLGGLCLPVLRAMLSSGVAALCPTPELKEDVERAVLSAADSADSAVSAARSAAISASSAARSAVSAALSCHSADHSAALSARSAAHCAHSAVSAADSAVSAVSAVSAAVSAARSAAFSACSLDTVHLDGDRIERLFEKWLWPSEALGDSPPGEPEGLAAGYAKLSEFFDSDPAWSFWKRWLEGMRTGRPMDWKLQEQIALIPDKVWEAGPSAVAERIAALRAPKIAALLQEDIARAETGALKLTPKKMAEGGPLGLLLDTVEDSLDLATSGQRNALSDDAYQVRLLRRTFARYGNDPQRIEMDFERARVSLIEDIAAEDIPASAANRDLIQSLADASGAIRASDPGILANRAKLNEIRLGEIPPESAQQIADIAASVADLSEGILAEDLREDRFALPGVSVDAPTPDSVVPLGGAERNKALETRAAQIRLFSRLSKVWLFLKAHPTEVATVTSIVGALSGVIGVIVALVAL